MSSPRILIIDDEPRFAEPIRKALSRAYYSVKIANSLRQARTWLSGEVPDAIILDLMYRPPGAPQRAEAALEPFGYNFLVEIKGDLRTARIPVIVLTVVMDEEMEAKCLRAGAKAYIQKTAGGARMLDELKKLGVIVSQAVEPGKSGTKLANGWHNFFRIVSTSYGAA